MLNAGQTYCRMLQGEHSAILSTCIKLPFVIKVFVLSIFEWTLKTGFAVHFLSLPSSISLFAYLSSKSSGETALTPHIYVLADKQEN